MSTTTPDGGWSRDLRSHGRGVLAVISPTVMGVLRRLGLGLVVALATASNPVARAHVADTDDWSVTYRRLVELFPEAAPNRWKILRYRLSGGEAKRLSEALGFPLDPLDREPLFYVAYGRRGQLLGVAMFIEPHTHRADHASFEVDVGVDPRGRVAAIQPHHPIGLDGLAATDFLEQLRGRSLSSGFSIASSDLHAVPGLSRESQLVANAAHEALLFMKVALGRPSAAHG